MGNETNSVMRKTTEERNKIVHPNRKGIKYVDKKKKDEAIRLLSEAKKRLRRIKDTSRMVSNR